MAGRREGEKRMDMARILKRLRFFVIVGAVFVAGLGLNKLEVQAAGIHVDEAAGIGSDSTKSDIDGDSKSVAGSNPSAEWLWDVGAGKKDMHGAMLERKLSLAGDNAPAVLDISKGKVVLSKDGAYTQEGTDGKSEGIVSSEQFTINGSTSSTTST